ncbi:PREDICTED: zinc finger protein 511 [Acromyrmex echinatior]|uniref:Zinc finger protein 511 n=1 Tax=Acromyrmex echinatior TaxID=103372 RepID=F4X1C7_ACREC|nr:PREDICTED: zinc finger protein 511 [Acromyrmex echinatior]EGI59722.1 Zinc finger protein 511 [Acromyrmex echinatior]
MEEVLQQLGVGIRPVNDPFFEDSYKICKVFQRKGVTIDDEEELCHEIIKEFPCYIPGCKNTFQTLLDYEMHYNSSHRYACTECKVSKPNPRLLEIHIQETHDTFFKVLSEKQAMYQCYDSECDIKFNNPMERKEHCITVHKFPKKYRFDDTPYYIKEEESNKMEFDIVDNKKKKKPAKILLNKNQKSKMFTKDTTSAVCKNNDSVETISSTSVKSKITPLAFIPRQVQKSFSKVLTNNQNREKNVLESDTMMELANTLPD